MTSEQDHGSDHRNTRPPHPRLRCGFGESTISSNILFHVLTAETRRRVIECMLAVDGCLTVEEVVDHVVAQCTDPDDPDDPETVCEALSPRKRVLTTLQHIHLPKLTEAGMVSYDAATETIEPGPNVDAAAPHLALLDD
ncbi:DUF7344 domain-containing protein [Haloferacaceae archaeon DSL9]